MGRGVDLAQTNLLQKQSELARQHFDSQLIPLGLSREQIEAQSLEELEQSLMQVNDAIDHPEAFGSLKLKVTADLGLVISQASAESFTEVGILPILLERKRLILERIALLKSQSRIGSLEAIAKTVSETETRESIQAEIDKLRLEFAASAKQTRETEEQAMQARLQYQMEFELHKAKVEAERAKTRTQAYQAYLTRDTIATLIGAILLVVLTVAQLLAMFFHVESTEIVNNSFLVILGYFFGQTVARAGQDSINSGKIGSEKV